MFEDYNDENTNPIAALQLLCGSYKLILLLILLFYVQACGGVICTGGTGTGCTGTGSTGSGCTGTGGPGGCTSSGCSGCSGLGCTGMEYASTGCSGVVYTCSGATGTGCTGTAGSIDVAGGDTLDFEHLKQFKLIFDSLSGNELKLHTVDGGEITGQVHSCTYDGVLELWGGIFVNIDQLAYFELVSSKSFADENIEINYSVQYDSLKYEIQEEIGIVTEVDIDDEIAVRAGGCIIGEGKTIVTDKIGPLLILDDKYAVVLTQIQWFEFV